MVLERCTEQGAKTLDAFYASWSQRGTEVGTDGQAMLALIAALRESPDNRKVWGLTSHAQLYLLADDKSSCPWYVKIFAASDGEYDVDYLMPECQAPWPNARVGGSANSVDQAVSMVRVAMDRSRGWSSSTLQNES